MTKVYTMLTRSIAAAGTLLLLAAPCTHADNNDAQTLLDLFRNDGIPTRGDLAKIQQFGTAVCMATTDGMSFDRMVLQEMHDNPSENRDQATDAVADAQHIYCPDRANG
jgi:ABC-type ATPase involved in cell division